MSATDAQSAVVRESVNEFYDGTLTSRGDNAATSATILVMQRLHMDDLAGHLVRKGGWQHLKLQAIATEDHVVNLGDRLHHVRAGDLLSPSRLPKAVLDDLAADMGSYVFSAQYQQNPVPAAGNMVKSDWLRHFNVAPSRASGDIILSLDTATKTNPGNDYSVCTVWHRIDPDHYLIDVWRDKVDYPDLRKKLMDLVGKYDPNRILIEDHGNGAALIQELRSGGFNIVPRKTTASKESRLSTASALIEGGHLVLPKDAPWLASYMSEILAFPGDKHDDQVDSTSQYLNWAQEQSRLEKTSPKIQILQTAEGPAIRYGFLICVRRERNFRNRREWPG